MAGQPQGGAEDQALGIVQPAAARSDEGTDERPRCPVVAQDLVGEETADIEVAIGAEDQAEGTVQPAAAPSDEGTDERPRCPVVAQDLVGEETVDIEVAIGAEDQALGTAQPAAARRDEGIDERPRCPVVAQDLVGGAAHQQLGCPRGHSGHGGRQGDEQRAEEVWKDVGECRFAFHNSPLFAWVGAPSVFVTDYDCGP